MWNPAKPWENMRTKFGRYGEKTCLSIGDHRRIWERMERSSGRNSQKYENYEKHGTKPRSI